MKPVNPGSPRWKHALVRALVALAAVGSAAGSLPPGFVEENVFSPQFNGPETLDFQADGTMWIGRSGPGEGMNIWVAAPGASYPTLVHDFGTVPSGERGIHTIRLDPDFDTNGYLWVYYTVIGTPTFNRLSHFTVSGGTLTNETVVYEGPSVNSEVHNGGCLEFAADGTIFLGAGDDTSGNAAKDPFSRKGKILHMTPSGAPAADNPYLDGTAGDPLVWAMGLRNPFRCAMQPGLDNLFVADVGGDAWEEISIGVAGADFGWPACEGPDSTDTTNPGPCSGNYVLPIHAYEHFGQTAAIIGGVHIGPGQFAPQHEGDYFFSDWWAGDIRYLELDASNNVVEARTFSQITPGGRITDFAVGPDGALYYVARGAVQNVVRISWVGGDNGQPDAHVQVLPDRAGAAPLSVTLDGSGSSDPDDDPLTFAWDLGDASSATTPTVNKTYPQGVYEVELTVDDGLLTDRSPSVRIVSGNTRPTATVSAPADGAFYSAGDTIAFGGTIGDAEDPGISGMCQQFTWQVIFHHLDHTHPFLGPVAGACSGTFDIPLQGETSPITWYEVKLVASDFGSPIGPDATLVGEQSVEIHPNLSTITLETDPPGLQIALDGQPQTTPTDIYAVVNMTRSLDALDGQASAGREFEFLSWSDGGAEQHDISVPAAPTTYTASYACASVGEVTGLRVQPIGESVRLTWDAAPELCLSNADEPYKIYAAPTHLPASGNGAFPFDPVFREVGTASTTSIIFQPLPSDAVFLVVAFGKDDVEGPSGHYEP